MGSAQLRVSAALVRSLDVVAVTVTAASPGDWVAVYCLPPNAHAGVITSSRDFLDRRDVRGLAEETLTFGPLVNMRCELQFQLISAQGDVVATAPTRVRFHKGPAEPSQLHLAMTTRASEMRIAWTSTNGSFAQTFPRVRYGESTHALDREAPAAAPVSYDADDMCSAPATDRGARAFRDPGVILDATMTGLIPGKQYYYQVGHGLNDEKDATAWSEVQTFRVPPAAATTSHDDDDDATPMSLFVLGDLMAPTDATRDFRVAGSCGTTMALIARDLQNQETDGRAYAALVHVGDLSYAAGRTYVWDHFGTLIEPVAARIPYMVSIGNHDFGYLEGRQSKRLRAPSHAVFDYDETKGFDSHGECGVPTEARFRMPTNGNGLYWYSFEVGLTHHTVLSGEHDFSVGAPMHEWLLQDLAGVDRAKTPWLFVHIHRPLYCSVAFHGDYVRSLYLRDELESVFATYRVDIVFSGHYHSYERTCPVYDDHCHYGISGEAHAPVHIMVGSGGANVDTFGHYSVPWSESAKLAYGYGRIHVFNASHALFEFVENDARDVTDSMWIVSNHKWSRHQTWRWRRVVFHPSLGTLISMATCLVMCVLWMLTKRHNRRRQLRHDKIGILREGKLR